MKKLGSGEIVGDERFLYSSNDSLNLSFYCDIVGDFSVIARDIE